MANTEIVSPPRFKHQNERRPTQLGRIANANLHPHHRVAVTLDCEMGISSTSENELIRLTAIDFFTHEILLDHLVFPDVPLEHYNTRYSGVTRAAMRAALHAGTAIHGRNRAHMALLQFVGPETVVVVHGGSGDFNVLRWIRPSIADTLILEGYNGTPAVAATTTTAEGGTGTKEGKSLKELCKRRLGIEVKVRNRAQGKLGHYSYEDAMVARELLVAWMSMVPDA